MTVGVDVGVGVGETLLRVGVGVGVGECDELQPLNINAITTDEAVNDTEIRDFFIRQIYSVIAGVALELEM